MAHSVWRILLQGTVGGGGGGGGGGFNTNTTPPSLGGGSGCRLYVAAGHGLYTDAGSTLATAAGDVIRQWNDYSGNNNHLTQTNVGSRPTAGASAQMVFDSTVPTGQNLDVPGAVVTSVTDGELFGLIKLDAQPQSGPHSGGLWCFGGNDLGFYPLSTSIFEGSGTTGRYNFTAPSGLDSWHVYSVKTSGTNWDALKDNSAISGSSHSANSADWTAGGAALYVGANRTLAHFLKGQIAAVVFYDGARSSGERASIVAALLAQSPP